MADVTYDFENGTDGDPITATWDARPLTAVDAFSEFNAATHFPDEYYVIRPS